MFSGFVMGLKCSLNYLDVCNDFMAALSSHFKQKIKINAIEENR